MQNQTKVKTLSPRQAFERIQNNPDILFIDVRTYAENKFVGRPPDAVLVAWIDGPSWEINPRFPQTVGNLLAGNSASLQVEIILICRSGVRSLDAAKTLVRKGFTNVGHVVGGFEGDLDENNQRGNINGWRFEGLAWEQC